ncbi:hypothetical protein HDU99_001801 [Rhizoclosmatium hyalinum]|nr:hypothetical protein HDU99_001801 [Rhizoclosmatium hyalinum]
MQTGPAPAPLQQSTTTERTEVDQSVAAECAAVKKKGNQPAMVHNPKVVQVSKEVQYGHRGKINVNANDIEDDVHAIHLAAYPAILSRYNLKLVDKASCLTGTKLVAEQTAKTYNSFYRGVRAFCELIGDHASCAIFDPYLDPKCLAPSCSAATLSLFINMKRGPKGTPLLELDDVTPQKDVLNRPVFCTGEWNNPNNVNGFLSAIVLNHEARGHGSTETFKPECEDCVKEKSENQQVKTGCDSHPQDPRWMNRGNPRTATKVKNAFGNSQKIGENYVENGNSPLLPHELEDIVVYLSSLNDDYMHQIALGLLDTSKLSKRHDELADTQHSSFKFDTSIIKMIEDGSITIDCLTQAVKGKRDKVVKFLQLWNDPSNPKLDAVKHLMCHVYRLNKLGVTSGYLFPSKATWEKLQQPGHGITVIQKSQRMEMEEYNKELRAAFATVTKTDAVSTPLVLASEGSAQSASNSIGFTSRSLAEAAYKPRTAGSTSTPSTVNRPISVPTTSKAHPVGTLPSIGSSSSITQIHTANVEVSSVQTLKRKREEEPENICGGDMPEKARIIASHSGKKTYWVLRIINGVPYHINMYDARHEKYDTSMRYIKDLECLARMIACHPQIRKVQVDTRPIRIECTALAKGLVTSSWKGTLSELAVAYVEKTACVDPTAPSSFKNVYEKIMAVSKGDAFKAVLQKLVLKLKDGNATVEDLCRAMEQQKANDIARLQREWEEMYTANETARVALEREAVAAGMEDPMEEDYVSEDELNDSNEEPLIVDATDITDAMESESPPSSDSVTPPFSLQEPLPLASATLVLPRSPKGKQPLVSSTAVNIPVARTTLKAVVSKVSKQPSPKKPETDLDGTDGDYIDRNNKTLSNTDFCNNLLAIDKFLETSGPMTTNARQWKNKNLSPTLQCLRSHCQGDVKEFVRRMLEFQGDVAKKGRIAFTKVGEYCKGNCLIDTGAALDENREPDSVVQ